MAKICILSVSNIKHMSLISLYTRVFEERQIPYDVIYMDKYGEIEAISAETVFRFENVIDKEQPKLFRAMRYLRFIGFAKSVLNSRSYSFVIVWGEVTAFLFGSYLRKKYTGRYCLNIRDYFYQDKFPVSRFFATTMKAANFTTISSKGYRAFLPDAGRVIAVHSLNEGVLAECKVRDRKAEKPIRIGFIGYVRFYEINRALIDAFANDCRFELHYYGTHSEVLESYANSRGISNCVFEGGFDVAETGKFIDRIDIVNNLYGSGNSHVDYALSIKLYYSLYCNIPILVNKDTYMEEATVDLGIGFAVEEISDALPDDLYAWYTSLDYSKTAESCAKALSEIRSEQVEFLSEANNIANIASDE